MAKAKKAFFGLPRLVTIILACIPGVNYFCGVVQTIAFDGKLINGLFRIIFGIIPIIWILDIIKIVTTGKLSHFLILW